MERTCGNERQHVVAAGLDEVDARPSTPSEFGANAEYDHVFRPDLPPELGPGIANDSEAYSMNHPRRGVAFIFNHYTFDAGLEVPNRDGTNRDRGALKTTLGSFGFEVRVLDDPTFATIQSVLEKCAREDHSEADCLVIAVLTHGDLGKLYAQDEKYSPDVLWSAFTDVGCPSLKGKPKLFFVQACQGDLVDGGVRLDPLPPQGLQPNKAKRDGVKSTGGQLGATGVDGARFSAARPADSVSYKMLSHAHFLIAYATVPGYYSWRNKERGSWFIQSLCNTLREADAKCDLRSILTRVARKVALEFESSTVEEHMNEKKQIPCIASTLTADVFLVNKNSRSAQTTVFSRA